LLDARSRDSLDATPEGPPAGVAIVLSAVLTVVAIAHHPVAAGVSSADVLASVVRSASMDRLVHGVILVVLLLSVFGFCVFAMRRGLQRPAVLGGLIAYLGGCAALAQAAVIDGFLVPAVAEHARPDAAAAALLMLRTPALAIQSFTFVGIVAVSAAIVLWSIDLFRSGGAARAAGLAGGLAALVMLWTMALHVNHLNPQTLGFIVAAQAVWYAIVGALLIRGRI
jgi:hypothetical protein